MEYRNDASNRGGVEINVSYLLKIIFIKWWVILLIGVLGASSGFASAELKKTPTYTSTISFVVSNRALSNEDSYSSSDINASITMANTYKYILSSRTLCEKVAATCGIPNITLTDVSRAINMISVTNTNIIIMKITTISSARSYNLAVSVIENFGAVVETAGFTNSTLSVCELPNVPLQQDVNTSSIRSAVVGGFAGVVLALVIILITNIMKDTVQSVDEISARLDLNILGIVSKTDGRDKKRKKKSIYDNPIIMSERNAGFAFIETYKALRTKIENISAKQNYKVFVVSSTGEGEGKTTVSTNIAIALAQNGRSVLLIDADLRKPSVCRMLSLTNSKDNKGHSLPDVILDGGSYEKSIRYLDKHKIFILAGTSVVSEPTELLSTSTMEKVIKSVRNEFDFVIIDTAPAGVVTDASIITNYADALIMVIREDHTPVEKIRSALSDLSNGKADIIGCIYNNVSPTGARRLYNRYSRRYGYSQYGYNGYGYGYGYGYDIGTGLDKPNRFDDDNKQE